MSVDYFSVTYNGVNEPFYYIRLGALLQYIQNNIMYGVVQNDNIKVPMLNFDFEIESNLMFIDEYQISIDPDICLVNRTLKIGGKNYTFTPKEAEPFESPLFNNVSCYGQVMNIYIHMKWILLKLEELKDANNNKTILIDFLNNMLSSINSALGGVNNLQATVDETSNTIIIRDINPLPNVEEVQNKLNEYYRETNPASDPQNVDESAARNASFYKNNEKSKIETSYAKFDLYGYNIEKLEPNTSLGHASFIRDFNFTTELSPATSTMLTVGATANSAVVGENSTAFSRFNSGLVDRYKTKIIDNIKRDEIFGLAEKWLVTFNQYMNYVISLSVEGNSKENLTYNSKDATSYTNVLTNIINYRQQALPFLVENLKTSNLDPLIQSRIDKIKPYYEELIKKLQQQDLVYLSHTGFIPFNMSFTMDGLSGMKIYNKFYIDTTFLPSNYPDYAEFLIKNIVHKIENNKWTTSLESIITTKGKYDGSKQDLNPNVQQTQNSSTQQQNQQSQGNRDNCTIKDIPKGIKKISRQLINSYFTARNYSKAARAAIIANLEKESGLNLNAFNPAGGGCGAFGLAQWRGSRQTNLANYAKSIGQPVNSFEAQIGYLYRELETGELRSLYTFKNSTNPSEASFIFSSEFERFTGSNDFNNPEVRARQQLANSVFSKLI